MYNNITNELLECMIKNTSTENGWIIWMRGRVNKSPHHIKKIIIIIITPLFNIL